MGGGPFRIAAERLPTSVAIATVVAPCLRRDAGAFRQGPGGDLAITYRIAARRLLARTALPRGGCEDAASGRGAETAGEGVNFEDVELRGRCIASGRERGYAREHRVLWLSRFTRNRGTPWLSS